MKKLAISGVVVIVAVALFGFVSYNSGFDLSEDKAEQKVIPITGTEKSGYSETNKASI